MRFTTILMSVAVLFLGVTFLRGAGWMGGVAKPEERPIVVGTNISVKDTPLNFRRAQPRHWRDYMLSR